MSESSSKRIVQRWYQEMWNEWNLGLVDELVAPELVFRGSLGTLIQGREGLRGYIQEVRAAFPDFHNRIDVLVAEGGSGRGPPDLYRHPPRRDLGHRADRPVNRVCPRRILSSPRWTRHGGMGGRRSRRSARAAPSVGPLPLALSPRIPRAPSRCTSPRNSRRTGDSALLRQTMLTWVTGRSRSGQKTTPARRIIRSDVGTIATPAPDATKVSTSMFEPSCTTRCLHPALRQIP